MTTETEHHIPAGNSDRFAYGFVKMLRAGADAFFAKRYGHRAIVLETVAAVTGVREDEAGHRDVNHGFADSLAAGDSPAASYQPAITE